MSSRSIFDQIDHGWLKTRLPHFWWGVIELTGIGVLVLGFWQLRHTFWYATLQGEYFEWGSAHIYAADIAALLLIVGTWAVGQYRAGWEMLRSIWWPSLVILGLMLVSVLWSEQPRVAVYTVAEWWLWFAAAVALMRIGWKSGRAATWILIGILSSACLGIYQFVINHSAGWWRLGESVLDPLQRGIPVVMQDGLRQLRSHGWQPHPNIFGGMMAYAVALLGYWRGVRYRWVVVAMAAVLGVALVLSFARGAWLAMIVVVAAYSYLLWAHREKLSRPVAAGLIAGLLLAGGWQMGSITGRLQPTVGDQLETRSISERWEGYSDWSELMSSRWLVGYGWGNYPVAVSGLHPTMKGWEVAPVHNALLLWVGQLGALGVIALVWWCVALWRYLSSHRERWVCALPLLAWSVLGLFDHWTISTHQGMVAVFLALALIFWPHEIS